MKKLRLLAGVVLIFWNRLLLALHLRRPLDGWRRAAGLVLRSDVSKFVLSAFNLNVLSDASPGSSTDEIQKHIAKRLGEFLATESECRLLVRHDEGEDRVIPHSAVSYTLGFEPWIEGPARFVRPDAWEGKYGSPAVERTSPVFEFICRVGPDRSVDLWARINHVGTDGVPAQEMMSRLEQKWGMTRPVVFPGSAEFEPITVARSSPGRDGIVEVQTFVDFAPLLAWRKRENEKLADPMTFSAAMLWWLARHEVFSRIYLGTTVEIPQMDGLGRGVGVAVVRPADYAAQPDGLSRYVRDFNQQLELIRQRKNEGCRILDAAAHLPAGLEQAVLRHALDQGRAFGSAALTVLKDAKVFGAPLADTGHVDGFMAVGCVACESADGKRVGCVVVKGPRDRIHSYAKILREALQQISTSS